ncbi:hypothetical protein AcW1_006951 [Taiwanofungus camphoratus]|nr:hypothetical protein AcW1_006951 [Antrodia cinnamomea]
MQVRQLESPSEHVGAPVSFISSPFTGCTVRVELVELQKADVGRKYVRKDRRPLDTPPVVQVRLFDVLHAGTPAQTERDCEYKYVQHLATS